MMSKCVKNKEVAHEPQAYIYRALFFSVSVMFLPNFDGFCDLLNRPTATWNLFVLYNEQKGKKDKLALYHLTVQWFVPV